MSKLSASQRAELLRAYSEGEKTEVIAERFGVGPSYPTVLARRAGVALRDSDARREAMSKSAKKRAVKRGV